MLRNSGEEVSHDFRGPKFGFLVFLVALFSWGLLFSFLNPLVMALGFLRWGRQKGLILGAVAIGVSLFKGLNDGNFISLYVSGGSLFVAWAISQGFRKGQRPIRIITQNGGLVALMLVAFTVIRLGGGGPTELGQKFQLLARENFDRLMLALKKEKVNAVSVDRFERSFKIQEAALAKMTPYIPGVMISFVFLSVWVYIYFLLNWGPYSLENKRGIYPFTAKELSSFRMPDQGLFFLGGIFLLILGSDFLGGSWAQVLGLNALYGIGVFYFFQGIGLYLEFLTKLNIFGFFRSFLLFMIIYQASNIVAILGMLDTFFNFRRLLKRKGPKGES